MDTISQASRGAYVAKSKLGRTKSATAANKRSHTLSKSNANNNTSNMKVYIPEDYFKHTGYSAKK